MSDTVILVSLICITTLGLATNLSIVTYKKDKIDFIAKTNIKGVVNSEIAITGEDKESKK